MSDVDVTSYVDLTVLDRSPQSIYAASLAAVQAAFPDWDATDETDLIHVLLQAVAVEVSELVYAVNRTPGKITEVLLRLFGLEPDEGAPATADVLFTMSDNLGHVVPSGTRVRLNFSADNPPCDFVTTTSLTVPAGSTQGTVATQAQENSTRPHSAPIGTDLEIVDNIIYLEAAEFATQPTGGAAPESGDEFLARGVTRLGRLVTTLVLPEHFTLAALDDSRVGRATSLDNYDGVGANTSTDYGHVSVAVLGEDGSLLGSTPKSEIETDLEASALGNLDVHIIDPTITNVAITTTVLALEGYDAADVQQNIRDAFTAYLDPLVWDWDGTVYVNELIALVDRVEGVDIVQSLSITGGAPDLALTGVAPLADYNNAGTTVTVNTP